MLCNLLNQRERVVLQHEIFLEDLYFAEVDVT